MGNIFTDLTLLYPHTHTFTDPTLSSLIFKPLLLLILLFHTFIPSFIILIFSYSHTLILEMSEWFTKRSLVSKIENFAIGLLRGHDKELSKMLTELEKNRKSLPKKQKILTKNCLPNILTEKMENPYRKNGKSLLKKQKILTVNCLLKILTKKWKILTENLLFPLFSKDFAKRFTIAKFFFSLNFAWLRIQQFHLSLPYTLIPLYPYFN